MHCDYDDPIDFNSSLIRCGSVSMSSAIFLKINLDIVTLRS